MSANFLDELSDAMGRLLDSGLPYEARMQLAYAQVRDAWLAQGRYDALIAFVHYNWDSGNCDDFIAPLEARLLEHRDARRFTRLWKGILRYRLDNLWYHHHPAMTPAQAEAIDLSDFDPTSPACYDDRRRVIAHHRRFVLDGIARYTAGLVKLGATDEIAMATALREDVANLRRATPKPPSDLRRIDEARFWELIESTRAGTTCSPEFTDVLKARLAGFRPQQILAFERLFRKAMAALYTHDIWALAYITQRGCSDDGFDDFRAWVISRGRTIFEAVLATDIEVLTPVFEEPASLEPMLYVAQRAYEAATGEPMPAVRSARGRLKGIPWCEDQLQQRYPQLCAAFGYEVAVQR